DPNRNAGSLSLFFAHGRHFATGPVYDVGNHPIAIAAADFDGDGHPDLGVIWTDFGGGFQVLHGHGDGPLAYPAAGTAPAVPAALATGDFDRDGLFDFALATRSPDAVAVELTRFAPDKSVYFDSPTPAAAPLSVPIHADVNGDGVADVLVVDQA